MTERDLSFEGQLFEGDIAYPVSVNFASRYSLWINFNGRRPHNTRQNYERFTLQLPDRLVDMGSCKIIEEGSPPHVRLRLVPRRSIYDFELLLFKSKVAVLESASVNLPLILDYKLSIDPEFLKYVSDLTYDLNAYRAMLDEIDANIQDEPSHVKALLSSGVIETVGRQLFEYLERQHEALKTITREYSDKQNEQHGYFFRRQLWNIILESPIMARTNTKPRGYIGDSEMMHMIYLNDFQGDSTFGRILHKYSVIQPAAQAVRNRRHDLAEILRAFMADWIERGNPVRDVRLKVLSVACGPAMELFDIIQSPADCENLQFALLDQDRHALMEAGSVIEAIEKNLGSAVSTDFIKESVRTLLVTRELQDRWGHFDFIYSMGLFDYLTPPVAKAVLKKLYTLLLPGGEMIIGNFSVENPTRTYMAYWMDWDIIYRSKEDMLALGNAVDAESVSVGVDQTGIQLFLRIRKAKVL